MNATEHKSLKNKQELLEKKKLEKIIRDWAGKNKKLFWKYEVSCFYKTYMIRVSGLPQPSAENITVSPFIRLFGSQQKKQLCDAITKASVKAEMLSDSSIDVQIDFVDGAVSTGII